MPREWVLLCRHLRPWPGCPEDWAGLQGGGESRAGVELEGGVWAALPPPGQCEPWGLGPQPGLPDAGLEPG